MPQGLKLFINLSGWLTGPLVFGLLAGRWLDNKCQTKLKLLLVCLGVAFIITCVGMTIEILSLRKRDGKVEIPEEPKETGEKT